MLFSDFVLSVVMAGCAASILLPTTSASDVFTWLGNIDDVIAFVVVWSGLEHFGIFNLSKVWTRDPDQPE
jgi:hypothetical protein